MKTEYKVGHLTVGWDDNIQTFYIEFGEDPIARIGTRRGEIVMIQKLIEKVQSFGLEIDPETKLELLEDFYQRNKIQTLNELYMYTNIKV